MSDTLEQQLVKHLEDAHAMEQNVLRMLDGMIATTQDRELLADFRRHKTETERHLKRIDDRLGAYDRSRNIFKDLTAMASAIAKLPIDIVRSQPTGHNVRDAYATEAAEIASYRMLEHIAELAGDRDTVEVARQNRSDEERMAKKIEECWDRFAEQSLAEAGVAFVEDGTVVTHPTAGRARAATRASGRGGTAKRSTAKRSSASRGSGSGSGSGGTTARRSGGTTGRRKTRTAV